MVNWSILEGREGTVGLRAAVAPDHSLIPKGIAVHRLRNTLAMRLGLSPNRRVASAGVCWAYQFSFPLTEECPDRVSRTTHGLTGGRYIQERYFCQRADLWHPKVIG